MALDDNERLKISRFMSFVLRHKPEAIGLVLDRDGWIDLSEFVSKLSSRFPEIEVDAVVQIVETDVKGRYSITNNMIRANQGHSIDVCAVELIPLKPPRYLYHGTTLSHWEMIKNSKAIKRMSRHHVHLSVDLDTAKTVASRRQGQSVILRIKASEMASNGIEFYRSENGVWHVDEVILDYVEVVD